MTRFVVLSIAFPIFTLACGPGRQAAWEKPVEAAPAQPTSAAGSSADGSDAKAAAEPTDPRSQAKAAWDKREERAELEKAIALWEQVLTTAADDADVLMALSRGYSLLGDGYMRLAGEDPQVLMATFEKGVQAGERAMLAVSPEFAAKIKAGSKFEDAMSLIPPRGQPALYWYAVNMGKFAIIKGFTTTLFYKDRIVAIMRRVMEIDEKYFHGAPHRYFVAFYAKAPAFAGGDMNKAKEHFDKAMAIEPNYFSTKTVFAEFYAAKVEDRDLFTKLLTEVQQGDPSVLTDVVPEQKLEQRKAALLMKQADDLF